MTHAMVLVAVHLDPLSNRPVRWKVENSWGSESCNRGFFVMSDDWFTVSRITSRGANDGVGDDEMMTEPR